MSRQSTINRPEAWSEPRYMSAAPNFLQVLGLDERADDHAIRRAYARKIAQVDKRHDFATVQMLRAAYDAARDWHLTQVNRQLELVLEPALEAAHAVSTEVNGEAQVEADTGAQATAAVQTLRQQTALRTGPATAATTRPEFGPEIMLKARLKSGLESDPEIVPKIAPEIALANEVAAQTTIDGGGAHANSLQGCTPERAHEIAAEPAAALGLSAHRGTASMAPTAPTSMQDVDEAPNLAISQPTPLGTAPQHVSATAPAIATRADPVSTVAALFEAAARRLRHGGKPKPIIIAIACCLMLAMIWQRMAVDRLTTAQPSSPTTPQTRQTRLPSFKLLPTALSQADFAYTPDGTGLPAMKPSVRRLAFLPTLTPTKLSYPPAALEKRQQGRVTVAVYINELGVVKEARVERSSGFPSLDQAAEAAVWETRYQPYMEDGSAIPVALKVRLRFRIEKP